MALFPQLAHLQFGMATLHVENSKRELMNAMLDVFLIPVDKVGQNQITNFLLTKFPVELNLEIFSFLE